MRARRVMVAEVTQEQIDGWQQAIRDLTNGNKHLKARLRRALNAIEQQGRFIQGELKAKKRTG